MGCVCFLRCVHAFVCPRCGLVCGVVWVLLFVRLSVIVCLRELHLFMCLCVVCELFYDVVCVACCYCVCVWLCVFCLMRLFCL